MPHPKRVFECEACGTVKDRDFNASFDLANAVGLTVNACGQGTADSLG
jgi:transposase